MPEYRVIVNPYSHHQETARLIPVLNELFADMDCEFIVTKEAGDAERLAAASTDVHTVVAVGGDGTVHEITNGLMSLGAELRPALGIIPAGSGNDAAKGFGLPEDVGLAAAALRSGQARVFDAGRINNRYFAGSFSVGLDALVVSKTIEYKATHGWSGSRLYYSALVYVIVHELKPIAVSISYQDAQGNEHTLEAGVILTAVTNGQTYGSGIRINPSARPDDGALTLAWVDCLSTPATLARLPLIVAGSHEKIKAYHKAHIKHARIESSMGLTLIAQADGELFTDTYFEVETLTGALRVIAPITPE